MPTLGSINLLKSKTSASIFPEGAEESLRRLSYASVIILFFAGVSLSGAFFYVRFRHERFIQKRTEYYNEIINNSVKEGLYTAIKGRIDVTQKVMKSQRPYGVLFDYMGIVSGPGKMTSLSVDETGKARLSVKSSSIEETIDIAQALIALTKEGKIKGPDLTSFQFGKGNDVIFSVSFVPVL